MCNLYSLSTGQQAIRDLADATRDTTRNLPILPGIFRDYAAPIARDAPNGVRELSLARRGIPSPVFALKGRNSDPELLPGNAAGPPPVGFVMLLADGDSLIVGNRSHPRRSSGGYARDHGQGEAGSGDSDEGARKGPGLDAPPLASIDETCGIGPTAFIGHGPEADAASDHGMPERALGVVVGRRLVRIGDEGDDGAAIVEEFAGEIISIPCRLHWQFHLMRLVKGVRVGGIADALDETAQVAHQIATEAGARAVVAIGEGDSLADEMGQKALAARMISILDRSRSHR